MKKANQKPKEYWKIEKVTGDWELDIALERCEKVGMFNKKGKPIKRNKTMKEARNKEIKRIIEKDIKRLEGKIAFTDYPDTTEGRQCRHENRLYNSALLQEIFFKRSQLKEN